MPAAWIGAGAAAIGAIGTLSNSGGGGGGSAAGNIASGAANIAGGALAPGEAQQLANSVNPFGQYNNQFASKLAGAAGKDIYGNESTQGLQQQASYVNNNTLGLTSALNGTQIGKQLMGLLNDPGSIYSTPQYQAAFGQGQSAVNATLAAQGLNASGNQLAALQSYGQTFGQNAYNTQLSQLSGLYGQALGANQQFYGQLSNNISQEAQQNQQAFNQLAALSGLSTGSPQAAAGILQQGYASAGQGIGQGIGQLANGAGQLLNGLGGSGSGGFTTGLGTTTNGDISGSGPLFGTGAGIDNGGGFNYSGGNSWGFTG